ncbi:hypothetical protein PBI_SCTP2_372 [Salicola phage SCTP-2]|nr:hypothetical protein PBI_SCTP2_372 [Salicola phage SCTP-2]
MVKMQISGCYHYVIFYVTNKEENRIDAVIYGFDNATDMREDQCSDEQKLKMLRDLKVDPEYFFQYDCDNGEMSIHNYNHVRGNTVLKSREHVRYFSEMLEDCYDEFVEIHENNF